MMKSADEVVTDLMETAVRQGYYGVLILSQRCPGCGQLHDWTLMSSVGSDDPEAGDSMKLATLGILQDQIEVIEHGDGELVRVVPATN